MVFQTKITTRPVEIRDRNQLAHLIHFGTYVHRHLDWKPPLNWIGQEPFFVAETDERITASLACPPDPPGIAWLRMFVCSTRVSCNDAWDTLWPPALEYLQQHTTALVAAAIPLQKWFRQLLTESGFEHNHNVVTLAWDPEPGKISHLPLPKAYHIRRMQKQDLETIFKIDSNSFSPLWQNASDSIQLAYQQAVYASVVEEDGALLGYQISTQTPYGAHLGRLATNPEHQSKGVGYALLHDLVSQLTSKNIQRISVNTQDNNVVSQSLYHKAGFQETNEAFPVFLFKFD